LDKWYLTVTSGLFVRRSFLSRSFPVPSSEVSSLLLLFHFYLWLTAQQRGRIKAEAQCDINVSRSFNPTVRSLFAGFVFAMKKAAAHIYGRAHQQRRRSGWRGINADAFFLPKTLPLPLRVPAGHFSFLHSYRERTYVGSREQSPKNDFRYEVSESKTLPRLPSGSSKSHDPIASMSRKFQFYFDLVQVRTLQTLNSPEIRKCGINSERGFDFWHCKWSQAAIFCHTCVHIRLVLE
jgi:hypothetical protein